jgi:hypothetical protein
LAGIRAELEGHAQFRVLTVDPACPNAADMITGHHPRAVLFDLSAARFDFAVALLRNRPDLLLIGVDPSSDHLLVMRGESTQALSLTDLTALIDRDEAHSAAETEA